MRLEESVVVASAMRTAVIKICGRLICWGVGDKKGKQSVAIKGISLCKGSEILNQGKSV